MCSAVFEQLLESATSWNPSAWGWQGGLEAEPLDESVISLILANGMARTALNESVVGRLGGGKNWCERFVPRSMSMFGGVLMMSPKTKNACFPRS